MQLSENLRAATAALLFCSGAVSIDAWADPLSFSTSILTEFSGAVEGNGTTSSSAIDGQNLAASFLTPGTSTMGASVSSDGSAISVRTGTTHIDDWLCATCSSSVAVALTAAISFDAVIGPGIGEFDLEAQYIAAGIPFQLSVSEDGGPIAASANWGIDPVDVVLTPGPGGITIVSVHFVSPMILANCNGTAGPCGLFSDTQSIALEMEGNGFVDASHTFSVLLAPTDPTIFLTSADGRTAGIAPGTTTVPEPASILLVGTGLLAIRRKTRRRQATVPFGTRLT